MFQKRREIAPQEVLNLFKMGENVPLPPAYLARNKEIEDAGERDGLSFSQIHNLKTAEFKHPKWRVIQLEHYRDLYRQPDLNDKDRNYIRVNAESEALEARYALKDKKCADFELDAKHVNGLIEEALQRDFWSTTIGAWRQMIKGGNFLDASRFVNRARGSCINLSNPAVFIAARTAVMVTGFVNNLGLIASIKRDSLWYSNKPTLRRTFSPNFKYYKPAQPLQ